MSNPQDYNPYSTPPAEPTSSGPTGYSEPPHTNPAYSQQQYSGYPNPNYPNQPYPGQPYYDPMARSQLAAGLLGVFLGYFGVHRFYLGYIGIGILQIVFTICTFGLAGLWGFIEGIMILAGASSFRVDASGRPLRQ